MLTTSYSYSPIPVDQLFCSFASLPLTNYAVLLCKMITKIIIEHRSSYVLANDTLVANHRIVTVAFGIHFSLIVAQMTGTVKVQF